MAREREEPRQTGGWNDSVTGGCVVWRGIAGEWVCGGGTGVPRHRRQQV